MPTSPLRCAEVARADGYLPAGTAASAPIFLLVELPLPWPADISEHPVLQDVAPIAAAARARIQGLVPNDAAEPHAPRVIVYRRPPGPFRRYSRHERVVAIDRLAAEIAALLDSPDRPDQATGGDLIDVLVCTHGSRDVCCGGDGMRVHRDFVARTLPGVRVWRTSHTGGHRFAPTAVTFPDGRAWASLDADILAGVVTRSLSPTEAVAHDRGCAAFEDPFAQAADSVVLTAEGWGWLDLPRTAVSEVLAEDRRIVTVTGGTNGDATGPVVYRAEVAVTRVVPVPDCGRPLEQARKTSRELEVVSLRRLA